MYLWNLEFWESDSGQCPVADTLSEIEERQPNLASKIYRKIDYFQKHQINDLIRADYLENLKNGLYEFKISICKGEYRFLGDIRNAGTLITFKALHFFQKKSQKIPKREIEVALNRLKTLR